MNSTNLSRALLNKLGASIVRGEYEVGKSLPAESDLAISHNVSRTAVREAIKMLSAKGLVRSWPRRGAIVQKESDWNLLDPEVMEWILGRGISVPLVKDFLNMRLAIEPAAVFMATKNRADISEIRGAVNAMRRADKDGEHTLSADCEFHAAILRASGNRFFAQMSPLVDTALRMTIRVSNQIKGVSMASIEEHEEILRAIESGHAENAHDLIKGHITEALKLVQSAYPENENAGA